MANISHGQTNTRLYNIYRGIKKRTNGNSKDEHIINSYTKKRISMCDEWKASFIDFMTWANNNGYSDNLTIDRIDNDGDYEPTNCRWVSMCVQAQNRRCLISTNTSGYRGVRWRSERKKWVSIIEHGGKVTKIGSFSNIIDAAVAYDTYVIKNNLNHTINFNNAN